MSTVEYVHITIGPDDVPMLTGTRIKVVEIVLAHLAYGWDARDICREFPHLTIGSPQVTRFRASSMPTSTVSPCDSLLSSWN